MLRRAVLLVALGGFACDRGLVTPEARVSGYLYIAGPLEGARVNAYRLDADCRKGELVGTSTPSAADGAYSVTLGFEQGDFLLEATGPASYEEVATGTRLTIDPAQLVSGVALEMVPNEKRADVVLSSLTTMARQLGCARHARPEIGFAARRVRRGR